MRALFFGTSAFAVPSLHVAAAKTELAGVVTQPDRPAGRGHRLQPTPVKSAALELGLPVFEPVRLRAFAAELAAASFDLFVLASYGRILPPELLALPRLGALNVHPSLLPKYRGATPIQTAIARGERETGVSIMLMDAGLDTGEIVLAERTAIAPAETYGELHDRLAQLGADLLGRTIDLAAQGALTARPQTGEPILTRPISKADLAIDWSWPAAEDRRPRARVFAAAGGACRNRRRDGQGAARSRRGGRHAGVRRTGGTQSRQDERRAVPSHALGAAMNARELALHVVRDVFPAARLACDRTRRAGRLRLSRAALGLQRARSRLCRGACLRRHQDAAHPRLVLGAVCRTSTGAATGYPRDTAACRFRTRLHAGRRTCDGLRVRQPRQAVRTSWTGQPGQCRAAQPDSRATVGAGARTLRRRRRVSGNALFLTVMDRAPVAERVWRAARGDLCGSQRPGTERRRRQCVAPYPGRSASRVDGARR